MQQPAGVNGGPLESTFVVHRLGNDHAEGITTRDVNGGSRLDQQENGLQDLINNKSANKQ